MERLQKILSRAGIASRRAAEALIAGGQVTVNGVVVTALGTKADPDADDIRVQGRRVRVAERRRYLLLNKPRGYVTTRSDPEGRPIVLDLLEGVREYVYPVGRLDYDSEGLLILTNDGDLAARLTHPRHEVERVYEARVRGIPTPQALERLERGVMVEGRRTAPARVRRLAPAAGRDTLRSAAARGASPDALLLVSVREGRNRQVRKMCEAIGHPVRSLRRIRFGPIRDERLRPGEFRDLRPEEIVALRRAAGLLSTPVPEIRKPPGTRGTVPPRSDRRSG
jgi:pseudouridine synthase